MPDLHLSTFELDVSPPPGHPLCGGWIRPVEGQDDPLWFRGVVLQGSGRPIVLAALDWTGVGDEAYIRWVDVLARAARTDRERVSLHCVHQHNAPLVNGEGNRLLREAGAEPLLYDEAFVAGVIEQSAEALGRSLIDAEPVDRLWVGRAQVREVACNRRVIGPDGKVKYTRYSATTNPAARAEPEGTIDPWLRSLALARRDRVLARLYFYTTHPMSYYGDGRVSADFVGLARARRDREEPGVAHLYFTGCAGNVTAGKYNDGSRPMRGVLADRVHAAMVEADRVAEDHPLTTLGWRSSPFRFAPREDLDLERLKAIVADPRETTAKRNSSAMACGWLMRDQGREPIGLGLLDLGAARALFLPAETFVEYQLFAQGLDPSVPLAVAAFGDYGPWYIPLARSYDEGGYEPTASWVSRGTEEPYKQAIAALLGTR